MAVVKALKHTRFVLIAIKTQVRESYARLKIVWQVFDIAPSNVAHTGMAEKRDMHGEALS